MISREDVSKIEWFNLPNLTVERKSDHVWVRHVIARGGVRKASAVITKESRGGVDGLKVMTDSDVYSIEIGPLKNGAGLVAGECRVRAKDAHVKDGVLTLGEKFAWIAHRKCIQLTRANAMSVSESWKKSINLVKEDADEGVPGYRPPQLGALHALAAHWSVKSGLAKIVLPTGTGKTDVLLSALIMHRPKRALVVVPSDALRDQVSQKFLELETLLKIGAITEDFLCPAVGQITKASVKAEDYDLFKSCNVVITTAQMVSGIPFGTMKELMEGFEVVMIDEAHHLAAPTWERIRASGEGRRILAVTATPFRNDGKKIPGETIYQFPLKLAQEQGYFRRIGLVEVDESDADKADEKIASAAISQLEKDEREGGWKHLVMARAKSIEHATRIYDQIYRKKWPELNPVLIHSKVPSRTKKSVVAALRASRSRVVVCVDMLGEGFDLPLLKIAAMHELHKSLPVTIQFVGRFTRARGDVGPATIIVNVADYSGLGSVSELQEQDADWNDLIPDLAQRAIGREQDAEYYSATMRQVILPETEVFDLGIIKPRTSASIFRVNDFKADGYKKGLSRDSQVHQVWVREDQAQVVLITRNRSAPEWTASKGATDLNWQLVIASYSKSRGLLYLYVSDGVGRIGKLAKGFGGGAANQVDGEKMFRALHGLQRSVLYNVGLYRKGNIRFLMHVGKDVGSLIDPATQVSSSKSNLFAVGYEEGAKTSIGASFKGKVWATSESSIPDWERWCDRVAARICDDKLSTDSYLEHTLIPSEISSFPEVDVFACLPPDEMLIGGYKGSAKFSVDGGVASYHEVDVTISFVERRERSLLLRIVIGEQHIVDLQLSWGEEFRAIRTSGPSVRVMLAGVTETLEEFLTENPPVLLLSDGSEVIGRHHYKQRPSHPYSYSPSSIRVIDWSGVDITVESKWKNGVARDNSIQAKVLKDCVSNPDYTFVIDDDDAHEIADIVALSVNDERKELGIFLFHCKFSSGEKGGARVKDVYEVCGQAIRSTRLVHGSDALLQHLAKREDRKNGRPTRFEKGSFSDFSSMRRRIAKYRARTQIYIVQPGISASALTNDVSSVLGAAESYVLQFTGRGLQIFGSA